MQRLQERAVRLARLSTAYLLLTLIALTITTCSDNGSIDQATNQLPLDPTAPVVQVTLDEWSVTSNVSTASAGPVTFRTSNEGSIPHNLEIYRIGVESNIAEFPIRSGVAHPEEDNGDRIGEIEERLLTALDAVEVTYLLESGRYALLCNVPGHYVAGMLTELSVK